MPVDPSAVKTWANLVTVARLLIAPFMFVLIPDEPGGAWPAFALWFLLCCTDGIDGYLARRHGAATNVGAFLDPLADKVLILGAMIFLVNSGVFSIVPVVIIAARELAISLYRTFVGAKGVSVPASKIAKIKTLTQQLSVGFALAPLTAHAKWLWNGLLWVSVALALISGGQYMWRARHPRITANAM